MPKILVADDSIAVRKVAERLLVGAGLEVALVANGEEALAWLTNERPDLIVSDVIMTDKSGYDVCAFVRSHATLSHTPVLLISGIVNEEVTRQAESCRADGVLKKPFQGTSLQDCVLELLAKRQAEPAGPAAVLTGAAPSPVAAPMPTSPKVYRITEEQLQAFRQATTRIKELETLLANEQTRSEHLVRQLETAGQAARRIEELEGLVAEEQGRSAQLARQVEALSQADSRLVELEARLAQEQARSAGSTSQASVHDPDGNRVAELEALLAQERERSILLLQRIQEAERAVMQADERLDAAARALTEVASLAAQRAKADQPIRDE